MLTCGMYHQTKFHHYFRKYFLRKLYVSQQNSTIITFLLRGCTTRPGRHGWCAKNLAPLSTMCVTMTKTLLFIFWQWQIYSNVYFGRTLDDIVRTLSSNGTAWTRKFNCRYKVNLTSMFRALVLILSMFRFQRYK